LSVALLGSAALIVATAAVHSIKGERRVMSAVATIDPAVLNPRLRRMIHFSWHLESLFMVLTAATVAWPGSPMSLVRLIGATYLVLGLYVLWKSRGGHVSGPLYTGAGLLAFTA
jgi:hypothetical protein